VRIVTVEARDGSRWRAPANLADRSVRMLYTATRETVAAGPARRARLSAVRAV